ncbi:MAG: aspartate kinase [Cyclobacteriaceae bacterium]
MRVFKFGGASVKDAPAIKNLAAILSSHQHEALIIVISAIGKTTNKLEEIIKKHNAGGQKHLALLEQLKREHYTIIEELGLGVQTHLGIQVDSLFEKVLVDLSNLSENKFAQYDAVVACGELLSTRIVTTYLQGSGLAAIWVDAREIIKTDDAFTEAEINWELTGHLVKQKLQKDSTNEVQVTQGFIGSTSADQTVTLGREGSDFSAAVIGYCIDAEEVVIWKDVPGILNADPKRLPGAKLIPSMSYEEAGEMTYYGAKVIHPKTMRPLALKSIPLRVRSFEQTGSSGTVISNQKSSEPYSAIIFNTSQLLISFRKREFSFIDERTLGLIFHTLDQLNVKINLMQNSATTFSICIDDNSYKLTKIFDALKDQFEIQYNGDLTLLTLNNYQKATVDTLIADRELILEQKSRKTAHFVYR